MAASVQPHAVELVLIGDRDRLLDPLERVPVAPGVESEPRVRDGDLGEEVRCVAQSQQRLGPEQRGEKAAEVVEEVVEDECPGPRRSADRGGRGR